MKEEKNIKSFESFVNSKIVNEEISGNKDKYEQWRRKFKGKAFASKTVYLTDPMGNEKRYVVFFKYEENPTNDAIYLSEKLIGGWEGSGTPFSLSNMQNKPVKLFDREEKTMWKDEKEFNKLIDNPKILDGILEEWFVQPFDEMLKSWFKSGVMTVDKISDYKILF